MLELLRQRRWLGFTAFAVGMVLLCLLLSRWQWHRYELRRTQNAQLDAVLGAPAVPIGQLLRATPPGGAASPVPPDQQWRTVTATGVFDAAAEVAVRRRPLDGRNGFWIVTPLRTDSGVVLVNRGWAPAEGAATDRPNVAAAPRGPVTVTGRLRLPEATEQSEAAPAGQAWALDPQRLIAPDTPRYDAYVELRGSQPPADAGLTALSDPGHRGTNNLIYSVQWIIFGLVAGIGWWRLLRQEQRRVVAGPDPSPDDDDEDSGAESPPSSPRVAEAPSLEQGRPSA